MFKAKLDEIQRPLAEYKHLTDFFTRRLRDGARTIDERPYVMCSPVDGTVVSTSADMDRNGILAQVKGIEYHVTDFLGIPTPKLKPGNALFSAVLYLSPGDYHRFHSPTEWVATSRTHFAGQLLPVNPLVAYVLPQLFCANERVAVFGEWEHGFYSYTAVGATNVGSIRLSFDPTVITNTYRHDWDCSFNPLEAAGVYGRDAYGHTFKSRPRLADAKDYKTGIPLKRGDDVGVFELGSTIVLIFEAPVDFKFTCKAGDKICLGQSIGRRTSPAACGPDTGDTPRSNADSEDSAHVSSDLEDLVAENELEEVVDACNGTRHGQAVASGRGVASRRGRGACAGLLKRGSSGISLYNAMQAAGKVAGNTLRGTSSTALSALAAASSLVLTPRAVATSPSEQQPQSMVELGMEVQQQLLAAASSSVKLASVPAAVSNETGSTSSNPGTAGTGSRRSSAGAAREVAVEAILPNTSDNKAPNGRVRSNSAFAVLEASGAGAGSGEFDGDLPAFDSSFGLNKAALRRMVADASGRGRSGTAASVGVGNDVKATTVPAAVASASGVHDEAGSVVDDDNDFASCLDWDDREGGVDGFGASSQRSRAASMIEATSTSSSSGVINSYSINASGGAFAVISRARAGTGNGRLPSIASLAEIASAALTLDA